MIGTCRFCGQLREVNAPDQGRADEKASRSCDCAGSGDYARKLATSEAVEDICENYDLTADQITVKSNSNGNTCLKIVQSEEENREITRDGVR